MQDMPVPSSLLHKINIQSREIEGHMGIKTKIWQDLDAFIPEAKNELGWPDSIFMPFGLWPCFLERHFKMSRGMMNLSDTMDRGMIQLCSAVAPWRATQDIIKFDPDVRESLAGMGLDGKIPSSVLLRFPAWCVWIDAPGLMVNGDIYSGFFAFLDKYQDDLLLALTFEGTDNRQERIPIVLGDLTLAESVARVNSHAGVGDVPMPESDKGLIEAINLVTYVCAYGLDDSRENPMLDTRPIPRRTKRGWRIFPPDRPKIRMMGLEFGEGIRRASHGGNGRKRPHIRRPHWHGFWTGGKDSPERKLDIRWLPPIFVGGDINDEDEV